MRPGWAKRATPARRGVDQPFAAPAVPSRARAPPPAPRLSLPRFSFSLRPGVGLGGPALPPVRPLRPLKLKSCWSQSTKAGSPPPVPALPPRAHPPHFDVPDNSPTSTFYIDLERDGGAVVPVAVQADSALRPVSYGMFPEDVVDPDQPVTRSLRTQWVRADSDTSSLK